MNIYLLKEDILKGEGVKHSAVSLTRVPLGW